MASDPTPGPTTGTATGTARLGDWAAALAVPHGDPGGGAAGAVALALAAALCEMVAGYPAERDEAAVAAVRERSALRRPRALALADADGAASLGFAEALRLPEGPGRAAALREASLTAAESAVAVGDLAALLVDDLEVLDASGSALLASDVVVAGALARAALASASANIAVDLAAPGVEGDPRSAELRDRLPRYAEAVARIDRISAAH